MRMKIDPITGRPLLLFPEAMVELSGSGPAIVSLCDGVRPLREIVSTLSQQFQAPEALLQREVSRYLLRLNEKMLIRVDDSPSSEPTAPAIPFSAAVPAGVSGMPRPLGLLAEVSYRCPLHCPYCSNPAAVRPAASSRPTSGAWSSAMRLGSACFMHCFPAASPWSDLTWNS